MTAACSAPSFGDWVLGDALRDLVLELQNSDKTVFDMTGVTGTPKLVALTGKETTPPIDVTGSFETVGLKNYARFPNITGGVALGTAARADFTGRAWITKNGKLGATEPFEFGIVRFPTP